MPTYEFECRDCRNRLEVIALITEHAKLKDQPPGLPAVRQGRHPATGLALHLQDSERYILTEDRLVALAHRATVR
jgi:hypothetical protein